LIISLSGETFSSWQVGHLWSSSSNK
jgi:hypothetical protein